MKRITIIGYGNQGRAWAANLRDSDWDVSISGRSIVDGGSSLIWAKDAGLSTIEPENLATDSESLVALLMPDEEIADFYQKYFHSKNRAPKSFIFAHGFSVVYGSMQFQAEDDLLLVAPKGIGSKVRQNYIEGSGVMGVIGVEQDASTKAWDKAKSVATGLGCGRVEIVKSSFREETNADLLSEQLILCGALPTLLDYSVRFLVKKGINPKIASYESLNEMKLIVDMMVEKGVEGMLAEVSNTAKFGGMRAAQRLFPEEQFFAHLEQLWGEIESGRFAAEFNDDRRLGFKALEQNLKQFKNHPADQFLS